MKILLLGLLVSCTASSKTNIKSEVFKIKDKSEIFTPICLGGYAYWQYNSYHQYGVTPYVGPDLNDSVRTVHLTCHEVNEKLRRKGKTKEEEIQDLTKRLKELKGE